MRGFIAYSLSEKFTQQLVVWQQQLQQRYVNFKPSARDNLHLTTAFLGDGIAKGQIQQIQTIINVVNSKQDKLQLETQNLSGFPLPKSIRSSHVKVAGSDDGLLRQQIQSLRFQLKQQQIWFDDRRFRPHVTLGRFQHKVDVNELDLSTSGQKFTVKNMVLIKSKLTKQGPVYNQLP